MSTPYPLSTTPSQHHPDPTLDRILGSLYLLLFLLGCPGNLAATIYFLLRPKELPTLLYSLTALTDLCLASLSVFVGVSCLAGRNPLLFDYPTLCSGWSLLFHGLQCFSVSLIAILSLTRTYSLFYPLRRLRRRRVLVMVGVCGGVIFLLHVVPGLAGLTREVYTVEDVYCWTDSRDNTYPNSYIVLQVFNSLIIVLPFPVVTVSCLVSVYLIYTSLRVPVIKQTRLRVKRDATITIVIVTVMYLVCNIPMVTNMVIWLYELVLYNTDTGPFYESNTFTKYYIWNIADVLCVVVNGTSNFVVYFTRKRSFRNWILNTVRYSRYNYNSPLPYRSTIRSSKSSSRSSSRVSVRAGYRPVFRASLKTRESSRASLKSRESCRASLKTRESFRASLNARDSSRANLRSSSRLQQRCSSRMTLRTVQYQEGSPRLEVNRGL